MKVNVLVINETADSYQGKKGLVENYVLTCLDNDPNVALKNTFDYVCTPEEAKHFGGKLKRKVIDLAINDIQISFGGRFRFKGEIVKAAA